MSSSPKPILKFGRKFSVRILRPVEYEALTRAGNKVQMDAVLYTGMRYVEAQRLHENPSWFDPLGHNIHLPPSATLKGKRRQLDRYIRLNYPGVSAVEMYLRGKPLPSWSSWTHDLRNWAVKAAVDPVGLGPKTLRKTWESWLVMTYQERLAQIVLNQGHTALTAVGHYINIPFTDVEKAQMLPYVEGVF